MAAGGKPAAPVSGNCDCGKRLTIAAGVAAITCPTCETTHAAAILIAAWERQGRDDDIVTMDVPSSVHLGAARGRS